MRYYEKYNSFEGAKIDSPLDFLRFITTSLIVAPIRICLEFSRKILFTGEYLTVYLKNCLKLSVAFLLVNTIYRLVISGSINLYNSFMPLPVQYIVLFINVIIYVALKDFKVVFDYTNIDDEKSETPDDDKSVEEEEKESYSDNAIKTENDKINIAHKSIINDEGEIDSSKLYSSSSDFDVDLGEDEVINFMDNVIENQNLTSPTATIISSFMSDKKVEKDLMENIRPREDEDLDDPVSNRIVNGSLVSDPGVSARIESLINSMSTQDKPKSAVNALRTNKGFNIANEGILPSDMPVTLTTSPDLLNDDSYGDSPFSFGDFYE